MRKQSHNIVCRVAQRALQAYRAKGDMEKVMGHILTRSLGILDAPKEFFEQAVPKAEEAITGAGLTVDLKDPETYPHIQRVVREVADDLGLF